MGITADQTLAQIVDLVPGAPRVLERHGLDYCCGGQQTLGAACERAGVDAAAVATEVDALDRESAPDWVPMSPALLVDHLEATHHTYLHAELPRLRALADKVAGVHGANHPELAEVARLCAELADDLEPHMLKEERILFPMVRELSQAVAPPTFHCGSVANPISMMMREHERCGELLAELRRRADGFSVPADGCASYRALYEGLAQLEADTHLHIHKENNTLFPAVIQLERRWS